MPLRALQGMKNSPIYAKKISSEIFEGEAYCIQDDLHAGFKHDNLEICKNLALKNMINIVKTAYKHTIKLYANKTKVGFMEIEGVGKGLSANGISVLHRHKTAA